MTTLVQRINQLEQRTAALYGLAPAELALGRAAWEKVSAGVPCADLSDGELEALCAMQSRRLPQLKRMSDAELSAYLAELRAASDAHETDTETKK